jgi:cellulose biosynthesis protein BcsQ
VWRHGVGCDLAAMKEAARRQTETFAIQGLDAAMQDIKAAREHGNPTLKLLGVILCNVDKRTRLSLQLLDYVPTVLTGPPSGGQLT